MKRYCLVAMLSSSPFIAACGGADNNPTQLVEQALCPSSLNYNKPYLGGGGNGELVSLQLDTAKMTWQITYLASPIPVTTGTVAPTRAGTSQSGTLTRETLLPTGKLNNCAYRLNGASLDPARPARVFIGDGVAGGTIPGARIQYGGLLGQGAVPDTTFPYYPFIGFTTLETNIASLAGTYNQIGYGQVPSQSFAPTTIDASVTIAADGTWSRCDTTGLYAGTCRQPGTNFAQSVNGSGAFETDHYQGQVKPTFATVAQAKGYLIVGKVRNQLVPIMVRTGVANPAVSPDANGVPPLTADDESGISILAPRIAMTSSSQNGEYIGVDSRFDYQTMALAGTQATLLDPFNPSQASLATALNLDYTQTVPGVVLSSQVGASSNVATGKLIFTGGVFGFLDNSIATSPYFTIGAFVQ